MVRRDEVVRPTVEELVAAKLEGRRFGYYRNPNMTAPIVVELLDMSPVARGRWVAVKGDFGDVVTSAGTWVLSANITLW